MNLPIKYVNVYLEDRAYGGPEEGGWWYDYRTPATDASGAGVVPPEWFSPAPVTQRTVNVDRVRAEIQERCYWANSDRRDDISSVTSEGRFIVLVEDHEPREWPETRPHYE